MYITGSKRAVLREATSFSYIMCSLPLFLSVAELSNFLRKRKIKNASSMIDPFISRAAWCCGCLLVHYLPLESCDKVTMSANLELDAGEACASFGIAAVDDVKLKYVMVAAISCIIAAMVARKIKRSRSLFTQPDSSYLGECPICILPLSLDASKSIMMPCCCKIICMGCDYANQMREFEQGLEPRCLFCREPVPKSQEESDKRIMKRIKKNDPVAMTHMGKKHKGEGDSAKAFEYYTKAAELGDVGAYFRLGGLYNSGEGVKKDMKNAVYHLEQAAIDGHPKARGILGLLEKKRGRFERAARHFIIAANLGCDISLELLKDLFEEEVVSKEEYTAALRGYQAAVDATKSDERDEAEAFFKIHASQRS